MKNKLANILPGVILILAGAGYLGNVFGLWNFSIFFDGWWTLFILIPFATNLLAYGPNMVNLVGLGFGTLLLFSAWDLISFSIIAKGIFPIVLILAGVNIIFKHSRDNVDPSKFKSMGKLPTYFAMFGGSEPNYNNVEFYGCNTYAIFGGTDLNLKNSIIKENVVITNFVIFGGADILLPPGVKVVTSSVPIFGGVSNSYLSTADENAPIVYVKSTSVFGGVDIK